MDELEELFNIEVNEFQKKAKVIVIVTSLCFAASVGVCVLFYVK
jgi:hypothetical protein